LIDQSRLRQWQDAAEVRDKLTKALHYHSQGLPIRTERLTVAKFLDQWLEASVEPAVKAKTWEGYESIVRVRIVPRIGRLNFSKVTPLHVQQLYANLQEAGLSAQSMVHTHRVLHRAFVQAVS